MGSIGLYTQRAAGADLVATFAVVQHETGRVVFNADRDDIQTPRRPRRPDLWRLRQRLGERADLYDHPQMTAARASSRR